MKIDFEKINRVALSHLESLCCEYLQGKRKGRNFVALNPTRADTSLGSFMIHIDKGNWIDFSTGDKGGDPVSLFAYCWNEKQGVAAKKLNDRLNAGALNLVAEKMTGGTGSSDSSEWEPLLFCEDDTKPTFKHIEWGYPTLKTEYLDSNGRLVGYVARYEHAEGKETIPMTYCKHRETGVLKWKWKGFLDPRPLLNLDKIATAKDSSNIIMVEGEKCAAAVIELGLPMIVTCWPGGTNAIRKIDFDPIKRHKVYFLPDNDEVGMKCANTLKELLPALEIVYPDPEKPKGYDIADYINDEQWGKQDIHQHIKTRNDRKPPEPEPFKNEPAEEIEVVEEPFLILGKDSDKNYCYYSKGDRQIHVWSATNHTKNNFIQLANWEYWKERFEGDTTAVSNFLIKSCQRKGIFESQNIRGRGVWLDKERVIYHAGGYLLVDGVKTDLEELNTNYIYEAKAMIETEDANPLKQQDAEKLLKICKMLEFSNDLENMLLAGFIVVAPICGVMPWRPHIWVSGSSGSGKTWITENLVHRMISKTSLMVQGNTTEAGIRQTLQSDARPVLIDEAESQDQVGIKRMQSIMELARQSSSPEGGKIIKGSATGTSVHFEIRSCFYFSSIGVSAKYKADLSRISILQLKKNTRPDAAKTFEKLEDYYKETFAQDWMADGLRARSFAMAATIAQNARTLSEATRVILGSRGGDQYGALLAGAYSLLSDDILTLEDAKEWIKNYNWTSYVDDGTENDETQALSILLESIVRHQYQDGPHVSSANVSISELICYSGQDSEQTLARHGLRYLDGFLYIANSHEQIKKLFANTQFADKWKDQFIRIKGAESVAAFRFGGITKRSVKIPFKKEEKD